MMKCVLIVSNVYPPFAIGGAEVVAHRQALGLKAMGYNVVVFGGRYSKDGDIDGALSVEEHDGILIYRLVNPAPADPSQNFWRPADGRRFASLLERHRPDIVHFHNVIGLGTNLIPQARKAGCRTVVTLHDYWGVCFKNTLTRNDGTLCGNVEECAACLPAINVAGGRQVPVRLRRDFVAQCLESADTLVSPSIYLLERIETSRLVDRPITRISNGVPLHNYKAVAMKSESPIEFACFSYIGEHKGIPTIVQAASILLADERLRGRWQLTFAGGGHLAGWLTTVLADEMFVGSVEYVGKLPHIEAQALQERSDVILLASEWPENEPVTLLEAIQMGKAQIASRVGGNPDLVDEGRSGLMFDAGDAVGLADIMRRLIETPGLASDFGRYNLARRDQFAEGETIKRLINVYESQAPNERSNRPTNIIVCAGRSPSSAFANRLNLMLARMHAVEDAPGNLRFIWHDWATGDIWSAARMLWIWGEDEASLALVRRSLRAGIQCLVPSGTSLAALDEGNGQVLTYDTLLEASGYLAALQDVAMATSRHDRRAERIVGALSAPASFTHVLPA